MSINITSISANKDLTPLELVKILLDSYKAELPCHQQNADRTGAIIMTGVIGDLEDLLSRFAGKEK